MFARFRSGGGRVLVELLMLVVGINVALIGMLRGAGATNTSLMINVVGATFQIPLSWFLGFIVGWGAFGVWVALPLSFIVRFVLSSTAYRRERWAREVETI